MNKGFSLVELIVVIAIMAILVGVAVPVYTNYISEANEGVDAQTADEVERAITTLLIDQDVANPVVTSTGKTAGVKITLTDGANGATFAVAGDVTDTDGAFITALTAMIPGVDLKSVASIDFTISADGYSVTNNLPNN